VIGLAPTEARTSPYKGLRNYTEADADYFFGRLRERDLIIASLKARRLTLLYGESGVGKTSMLRAGVVSSLRQQARADARDESLRGPDGRPVVEYVPVVFSQWRDDPLGGLATAIQEATRDLVDDTYVPPRTRRIDEMIEAAAAHTGGYLLLMLDQFEEYFLYHGDESGPGTFAHELVRAVNKPGLGASYLLSIREDALAKLDRFKREIPKLYDASIRVTHLDTASAREAIVRPVQQYNADRPGEAEIMVESDLVEEVLRRVRAGQVVLDQGETRPIDGNGHEGRDHDEIEAPYLQLVMERLWEEEMRRDSHVLLRETLDDLGGAERIVKAHLDDKLEQLDADERDAAEKVFRHLVTPSGTKIAHAASDLADYSDESEDRVEKLLSKLADKDTFILRGIPPPPDHPGPVRYEIFHDVLAGAIRDWRGRELKRKKEEAEREADHARKREFRAKVAAVVFLVLLIGGLVAFGVKQRNNASNRRAESQSRQLAANALEVRDLELASLLGLEGHAISPTFDAKRAILSVASNHELGRPLPAGAALASAYSPDGAVVASAGADGVVQLWRASDHARLGAPFIGHKGPVNDVEFSPKRDTLATAGADGTVRFWSVATHKELKPPPRARAKPGVPKPLPVNSVAFSPDGRMLVSAGEDGKVHTWVVAARREVGKPLAGRSGPISDVAFSPNGRQLATGSCHRVLHDDPGDHLVRLWDVKRRRQVGRFSGHAGPVCGVAFSPHGTRLASGSDDHTIRLWNVKSRKPIGAPLPGHSDFVHGVAFSPDGKYLASAGRDRSVRLWFVGGTPADQRQVGEPLKAHTGTVKSVAFNPKVGTFATAGADGVRLWTVADPSAIGAPITGARGDAIERWVLSVAFSPDGQKLAWIGNDKTVHLWDLVGRRDQAVGKTHVGQVNSLAFTPDGKLIASISVDDGTVSLWDPARQRNPRVETHAADGEKVKGLAISPDGSLLAYGANKLVDPLTSKTRGTVRLYDLKRHRDLPPMAGVHDGEIHGIAFSPDGKLIASGGDDRLVRLWDVQSRRQVGQLAGHTDAVFAVAFSPDGHTIASGGLDRTLRVWDVSRRGPIGVPMVGDGTTYSIAFNPKDKRTLASAIGDGNVQVWDSRTQRPLGAPFAGHTGVAYGVAYSPDGTTIATSGADGTVRVWRNPSLDNAKKRLCGYIDQRHAAERWNQMHPSLDFKQPC
jgi:WD40 repeat protein